MNKRRTPFLNRYCRQCLPEFYSVGTRLIASTPADQRITDGVDAINRVPTRVSLLLLQSAYNSRIFLGQGLCLLIRDGLGYHVEEGAVSVRQHQHPLLAQIDFDAIDGLGAAFAVLLAQNTHDLALVFPGAVDRCAAQIVGREIVHYL